MAMRGAAPVQECPRCGEAVPPTDAPLVTCSACKLAFTPRAEPRPQRPRAATEDTVDGDAEALGIRIDRDAAGLVLQWRYDQLYGLVLVVVAGLLIALGVWASRNPEMDESTAAMCMLAACALCATAVPLLGTNIVRIGVHAVEWTAWPSALYGGTAPRDLVASVTSEETRGLRASHHEVIGVGPAGERYRLGRVPGKQRAEVAALIAELLHAELLRTRTNAN